MNRNREAEVLLLELEARAQACGLTADELKLIVGEWPMPACCSRMETEASARRLYELLGLLRWLFAHEAEIWLRTPNRGLNGSVPIYLMTHDRCAVARLRDILRQECDAC